MGRAQERECSHLLIVQKGLSLHQLSKENEITQIKPVLASTLVDYLVTALIS